MWYVHCHLRGPQSLPFGLDEINVQSEEIVFESFLSWLDYDPKRRTDRLAHLFGLIKLPLIDKKVRSRCLALYVDHSFGLFFSAVSHGSYRYRQEVYGR